MVSTLHVVIGSAAVIAAAVGGAVYWLYQRRRQEQAMERIKELSHDISVAMDRRGARHPKLLQHKLNNAENAWENGEYSEAQRILEDVERLVQLS